MGPGKEELPLICFEDDDLLAVNKPAGLNTHAPDPYAGEGVYDWLRHREPRWASLAIIHRLDKETSGLIVFAKSREANRSLTRQFTERAVHKTYRLVTDRRVEQDQFTVTSKLLRAGEKYVSKPLTGPGETAETRFRVIERVKGLTTLQAEPVTGRTHQIRVQAATEGFPILGDTLYGGTPAGRVHLHAEELTFAHPAGGREMRFHVPADFSAERRLALRQQLIDPARTNAYRLIHGASDGWPGWYVTRYGDFLLSQSEDELTEQQRAWLEGRLQSAQDEGQSVRGAYHQILTRHARRAKLDEASPLHAAGDVAPGPFYVRENGLQYELSFGEGYSVGLFLDQRDNRRRFLTNHVAAGFSLADHTGGKEVLNTFAYTCAFSVCGAKAGFHTVSLDLARKYLEWGKRNFTLNELEASDHEFIFGDVFDWFRRWTRRKRQFDVVVLDPPTFSQSKESGTFSAEKDYGRLVAAAVPLLKSKGVLFASTNAARLGPEAFLAQVESSISAAGRRVSQKHYVPQPPDFPVSRAEPAYLKTAWLRID